MLLGICHAQSKIKSTNERAILMETGPMPSLFSVQENFPWPRKAFLSAYSEIPYLRSRDANLRAKGLEFVQKAILKLDLIEISDSHYSLSHNSKKIIMIEIDHSSLCLLILSLKNSLYCPAPHYPPLCLLLIFSFDVSRNAPGHFHAALIAAFAVYKCAQLGFSHKSTLCLRHHCSLHANP